MKILQKPSHKDIYFTLQNNNEEYNRPFKFIMDKPHKGTMFWALKSRPKCLLTGSRNVQMVIFFPSGINFSFLPTFKPPQYTGWEILPLLYALDVRKVTKLTPISCFNVNSNYSKLYQWTNQSQLHLPIPFQNMHLRHFNGNDFPFPRWRETRNSSNIYWSFP